MPAYHVQNDIEIEASITAVRAAIEDFHQWPAWSPWLCAEPETPMNFSGTPGQPGHAYDWSGTLVGAGEMTLDNIEESDRLQQLNMNLTFIRPFKSTARVRFDLEPLGDQRTHVTWHMDSQLPFFLFFMKRNIVAMITNDYNRGLRLLKDQVENGEVHCNIAYEGVVDLPSSELLTSSGNCRLDDIGTHIERAFKDVSDKLAADGAVPAGAPCCIYSDFDMHNMSCSYQAGLPVTADSANPGASDNNTLAITTIPGGKAFKVRYRGSYDHLGNAWSAGMNYLRTKKMKAAKNRDPWEQYVNDPADTPAADLVTEIYLPLR